MQACSLTGVLIGFHSLMQHHEDLQTIISMAVQRPPIETAFDCPVSAMGTQVPETPFEMQRILRLRKKKIPPP
jgi:hypothetical protein